MRVAVLGCSALSIGPIVAADLAGLGHEVRLAALDETEARRLDPATRALVVGPSDVPLLCGREAIAAAPFYQALPPLPADRWADWMRADVPFAHVPFVHLAEALGSPAPLHRGLVDLVGAVLGEDFWRDGLTLGDLGLADMTNDEMVAFVRDGRR